MVAAAAVAICALLSLVLATASASAGPSERAPRTHVVQSGETLWDVALEVDPTVDTRDVVERLVDLNGLASVDLRPGQELLLPSSSER